MMRTTLLASAALLGLAMGAPAFAQTGSPTATTPLSTTSSVPNSQNSGRAIANPGMTTPSVANGQNSGRAVAAPSDSTSSTPPAAAVPMRRRSSNIDRSDTRSVSAPRLPMPNVGPNADAATYVAAARASLQRGQTGAAQEALERAETRMLDRSTAPGAAGTPDASPMVKQISDARMALARGDRAAASQILSQSSGDAAPAAMPKAPVKGQSM